MSAAISSGVLAVDGVGGFGIDANGPVLEGAAGEVCCGGGVVHGGLAGHDDQDRLADGRDLILRDRLGAAGRVRRFACRPRSFARRAHL